MLCMSFRVAQLRLHMLVNWKLLLCTVCVPTMFLMYAKHGTRHVTALRQLNIANRLAEIREKINEAKEEGKGTLSILYFV